MSKYVWAKTLSRRRGPGLGPWAYQILAYLIFSIPDFIFKTPDKPPLAANMLINCPGLPVPLVGVGKLITGSVFHSCEPFLRGRLQMRQGPTEPTDAKLDLSLQMRQGPSGQLVADEG